MENRQIVPTPAAGESLLETRPGDFEPQVTSGGPTVEDRPTPPPVCSYDVNAGQDCPPSDAVKK